MTSLETALFESLREFFAAAQYHYLPQQKQFRRYTATGFRNVILSISPYEDELWVEVNLGLRKDHVEETVQQFLSGRTDFWKDTNTVIISIGKLTQNPYFRYKIVDEEDLELCQEQISHFMDTQGFDFLSDLDALPTLDLLFNTNPRLPLKYLYNQRHRCFRGLVLARLTHNARYNELKDIYREVLQTQGSSDFVMLNYARLTQFLDNYSLN